LVAEAHQLGTDTEGAGVAHDGGLEVTTGLALEVVDHPAADVRRLA
jgi:hypothetical protein